MPGVIVFCAIMSNICQLQNSNQNLIKKIVLVCNFLPWEKQKSKIKPGFSTCSLFLKSVCLKFFDDVENIEYFT